MPICIRRGGAVLLFLVSLAAHAVASLTWDRREVIASMSPLDKELVARFPFKNTGQSDVTLKAVRSLCDCTTVSFTREKYAPGEAGEIVATFVPAWRMGPQRNLITVETSDPGERTLVLVMAVEIPLVIKPDRPFLLWKEEERSTTKEMPVNLAGEYPIQGLTARALDTDVQVSLQRVDAKRFILKVTPPDQRDITTTVVLEAVLGIDLKKRTSVYIRAR